VDMSIAAGITATKATLELTRIISDLVKRPNIDAAFMVSFMSYLSTP